ncbi:MAG: glycosyltransferase family 4 protein [Halothiobacillaceae bacterium]
MRLLLVTRELCADRKYGLGQAVGQIAAGLRSKGHEVHYLSQAECAASHDRYAPHVRRVLCPFGGLAAPWAERLVQGGCGARMAATLGVTHVWFHDPWLAFGFFLYQRLHAGWRRPSFKIVISQHGLGSFAWAVMQDGVRMSQRLFRFLLGLERRILLAADCVHFPSYAALSAALRDFQFVCAPKHFVVLGYGRPKLSIPPKEEARVSLGLPVQGPVILSMGRLAPVKRFDVIGRAIEHLEREYGLAAQWVLAGDGDVRHLRLAELTLSLEPRISPAEDVDLWLAAADAYVSACAVESYGLANREAVAAGLPAIAACGGASCEVLGRGAWLVPAECNTLASALHAVLTQPKVASFWRQQAVAESASWPDWDALIRDYEQLLLMA